MKYPLIIFNSILVIGLVICSPFNSSKENIQANSSENITELVISPSNQVQKIVDIIIGLLMLFDNTRMSRRGHFWEVNVFEDTKETFTKTSEKNFWQKFLEFLFGNN